MSENKINNPAEELEQDELLQNETTGEPENDAFEGNDKPEPVGGLTKDERRARAREEYKLRERERIARQSEESARLEAKQAKAQAEGKTVKEKKKANPDKPGFWARIARWFKEILGELRHVTWPTWKEVVKNTSVVLVVVSIFLVVVAIMDGGLGWLYNTFLVGKL